MLTNKAGNVTCTIPVALEVTPLDTGTATFQVTDDLGNKVEKAQIKLYGRDPQVQIINGVETEMCIRDRPWTPPDTPAVP